MNISLFEICKNCAFFAHGAQSQTNQCGKKGFKGTGGMYNYKKNQANRNQFGKNRVVVHDFSLLVSYLLIKIKKRFILWPWIGPC